MKKYFKGMAAAITVLAMASCAEPEHVDVLVIGGGASGTAAAIQSADE